MSQKSIFDPHGNDENLQGGLDRFLGPQAKTYSHMPEDLEDGQDEDKAASDAAGMNCDDPNSADQPVCQIKKAEDEHEREKHGSS